MDRASFLTHLAWASMAPLALTGCGSGWSRPRPGGTAPDTLDVHPRRAGLPPIDVSIDEWRSLLSEEVFHILFEEGTERRYSSSLLQEDRKGTYICAGCRLPLFSSETKYESGTGWPSFWAPLEGRVDTKKDTKLAVPRTEYHCVRCEGHQGHIFDDGPAPTGLRYCNNGRALIFVPVEDELPSLRT